MLNLNTIKIMMKTPEFAVIEKSGRVEIRKPRTKTARKIMRVMRKHKELCFSSIIELTGLNRGTIKYSVDYLVSKGFLVRPNKVRGHGIYDLLTLAS